MFRYPRGSLKVSGSVSHLESPATFLTVALHVCVCLCGGVIQRPCSHVNVRGLAAIERHEALCMLCYIKRCVSLTREEEDIRSFTPLPTYFIISSSSTSPSSTASPLGGVWCTVLRVHLFIWLFQLLWLSRNTQIIPLMKHYCKFNLLQTTTLTSITRLTSKQPSGQE